MSGSFENKKALRFVITLSTGTFGSSSNNQITLEGFRSIVDIDKGGGAMLGTLRAAIYGVGQSDINSITTLQYQPRSLVANTISVYAIDGKQETLVFQGNMVMAWGNYQSMPEVFLQIQAQAAYFNQLQAVAPTSFQGTIDAATVMQQLAGTMGFTFENSGVEGIQLSNPYLPGTAIDQVNALAKAAGIWWGIDNDVLWITPAYAARTSVNVIPEIGPDSGLIGYPTFDGAGINIQAYFNPAVRFMALVNLVTSIPRAAGQWIATSVSYKLESEKPNGAWFMTVRGNFSGIASPN